VQSLVSFIRDLETLNAEQRAQRYGELMTQQHFGESSDYAAIRLSLLLSDPRGPVFAPTEALAILDSATETRSHENGDGMLVAQLVRHILHSYSHILHSYSVAHERLEAELSELRSALAAEQATRQNLQEQLDALKELERHVAMNEDARE
jgi:hypothetical protein